MKLKGKVALITGSGSGIGRASAVLFAREGARVVLVDYNEDNGRETLKIIQENGGEAMFIHADVSKGSDAEKMVREAVKKYGRLDILFNNAGKGLVKTVPDTTEEEWDILIDTNLKGVFLGSKYAIPEMAKNGRGAIINTASISGLVGHRNSAAYCASKGGIIMLTKAMAGDHAPQNIRVNCICPGHVLTPQLEPLIRSIPKSSTEAIVKRYPLGRLGSPEDIAYAALYLASDESSWVTGSALVIDGGCTAQMASLTEYAESPGFV
jgi:NAD(P)-dependent dehydrogenase (short-subunit alcohol dehydrogenase family)